MGPTRRSIIAAGAAAPFVLRGGASAASDPFTLGVASGEPVSDGFLIWTRLAPDPLAPDGAGGLGDAVEVRWEVFADEALRQTVATGAAIARPERAHSLHVEVGGLEPDRPYWYRFRALGSASPAGRTRTAPAAGAAVETLRVAACSCAHWETGHFAAYRHMAAEHPDLVLFLGDYIYEYSYAASRQVVRRHGTQSEARTLADYRNRYALHRTDPDLQALHAAAPCLAIWDDHEVQNDYGGDWSQNPTVPDAVFLARRAAAYQAFLEHMPMRPRLQANRIFDAHAWGSLAKIFMLDERQHRSRHACERANTRRAYVAPLTCPDLDDPGRSMLGLEQERWLEDGFRRSTAQWNIIGHQLMIVPYLQRAAGGVIGAYTDGWSGFGGARNRLLKSLVDTRLSNPVFVGGDLHAFLTGRVLADFRDRASRVIASEFVTTSVTSDPTPDSFAATLDLNPHVQLFENKSRGYLSMTLTPRGMETRLRAISDRADPGASVSTLRRFVVEAGRPGAEPA